MVEAWRRYKATEWLRQMDNVASLSLTETPSEEDFCLALRNGLILCNVLNKVNPGAVLKVHFFHFSKLIISSFIYKYKFN